MVNSIYGLTNYNNLFASPVSTYKMNPVSNLFFGSIASNAYSQSVAKKAQSSISSYLTSMNSIASNLKTSAKSLAFESPASSFNKKAVISSDNASVTGTAKGNADVRVYGITVSKLASSQVNKGQGLKSNDMSAINQGLNTFNIKTGSTTKTVAFTVNNDDTNKSALSKMASAINKSNAGVTASVVSDTKEGTSYLKLNSTKTGTDSAFTLNDITGNAVAATGADTLQEQAQDAVYSLDGKQYTSQSNTIDINNGKVQLTLNKADGKEIKLTVGVDIKGIEADITKFVNNYNNSVNLANQYADQLNGAVKLGGELESIINSRRNTLANIGITINDDNTLKVDEAKLSKALSSNTSYVKDVFSGNGGVAGKLYSKANEILTSPLKYSKPDLTGIIDKNYYNNILTASLMSNMAGMGLYSGMVVDTSL